MKKSWLPSKMRSGVKRLWRRLHRLAACGHSWCCARSTPQLIRRWWVKLWGEIARLRNTTPVEAMIDLSIEENLGAHFLAADMGHNDDDAVSALLNHPRVHVGASDGGAHILSFSTYGDTGYLLGHFVRETQQVGLEAAVKKITSDTASIWGIPERGQIEAGFVADITVFDPQKIGRGQEYSVADVPGDGCRYVRDAIGIEAVLVGGALTWIAGSGYTPATAGMVFARGDHGVR